MAEDKSNLRLVRIYLKDASFESPSALDAFKTKAEPAIELAMSVAVRQVSADHYEVVLTGNVTARADGQTLFLCEAQQAGLVMAKGLAPELLDRKLHVFFPKQLFPFLRETLANLTMKGGFPPVLIALVDFDELYKSRKPGAAQA